MPVAQRRLAGEPKVTPGLLPSSRIYARSCLLFWWIGRRRKPNSLLVYARFPWCPFPPCPMYHRFFVPQDILAQPPPQGASKISLKDIIFPRILLSVFVFVFVWTQNLKARDFRIYPFYSFRVSVFESMKVTADRGSFKEFASSVICSWKILFYVLVSNNFLCVVLWHLYFTF